jgi:hypothetical protein
VCRGRRAADESDFVHDQLACGRRFRILNIVDDVTRECLAAIPDTSISGRQVTRELEKQEKFVAGSIVNIAGMAVAIAVSRRAILGPHRTSANKLLVRDIVRRASGGQGACTSGTSPNSPK